MDNKTKTLIGAGVVIVAAVGVLATGFNPLAQLDGKKEGKGRTVTASISNFDPNEDVNMDFAWGTERPDDYAVQQAFSQSFAAMDECVKAEKESRGIKLETQLQGTVSMQVKLNPGGAPFGINAQLPKKYAKDQGLNDCLREAAASAPYPKYDGPPYVVNFEFDLDPGTYYEEE